MEQKLIELLQNTLQQLFGPLDAALGHYLSTVIGVYLNIMWKCHREQVFVVSYCMRNFKRTVATFGGASAAFFMTIIAEPGVGNLTYLAAGIAAESMLNKPPIPNGLRQALEKLQNANDAVSDDAVPDSVRDATNDALHEIGKRFVVAKPKIVAESKSG